MKNYYNKKKKEKYNRKQKIKCIFQKLFKKKNYQNNLNTNKKL